MNQRNRLFCNAFISLLCLLLLRFGSAEAATWTVTKGTDDGSAGTLRHAVANAADGDTIVFSSSLTSIVLADKLQIDKSLTIDGTTTRRTITCSTGKGGLVILPLRTVRIVNLKITGAGGSDGAGVSNTAGILTMVSCIVSNNAQHGVSNTMEYYSGSYKKAYLTMENCTIENNSASWGNGGGLYNYGGEVVMTNCIVRNNSAQNISFTGGGISSSGWYGNGVLTMTNCVVENNTAARVGGMDLWGTSTTLNGCTVQGNSDTNNEAGGIRAGSGTLSLVNRTRVSGNTSGGVASEIKGAYSNDGTCTVGTAPNASATALSGYVGDTPPEPRSIRDEEDAKNAARDLDTPKSALFLAVANALASDLRFEATTTNATSVAVDASLFFANTFENVNIESDDLRVEYTASWPRNVRYYAFFARADGSGYEFPERTVVFEIGPGQPLPGGVVPPDFYEEGEGLMTWRNVVADNGPYDHNREVGVVTFRVCSVRAEAVQQQAGGGGCATAGGANMWAALLLFAPFVVVGREALGRRARR